MWPVPMTMQTFAVLLMGATCGPRLGAAAVAAYLAEAALGYRCSPAARRWCSAGRPSATWSAS
jgi:hypothetical protein